MATKGVVGLDRFLVTGAFWFYHAGLGYVFISGPVFSRIGKTYYPPPMEASSVRIAIICPANYL